MTEEQVVELIAKLEDFADQKEQEGDRLGVTHLARANFATGQAEGARVAIVHLRSTMGDWPQMPENVWSETDWQGDCKTCGGHSYWVSCPTGGWWSHGIHPADEHEADLGWQPMQEMSDHGDLYTVGAFVSGI